MSPSAFRAFGRKLIEDPYDDEKEVGFRVEASTGSQIVARFYERTAKKIRVRDIEGSEKIHVEWSVEAFDVRILREGRTLFLLDGGRSQRSALTRLSELSEFSLTFEAITLRPEQLCATLNENGYSCSLSLALVEGIRAGRDVSARVEVKGAINAELLAEPKIL
ncbi:MAG: hypothetical protein AAGC74_02685, partial [Verrucomicrobiota bacterium]